jgi:hypothetical protein
MRKHLHLQSIELQEAAPVLIFKWEAHALLLVATFIPAQTGSAVQRPNFLEEIYGWHIEVLTEITAFD